MKPTAQPAPHSRAALLRRGLAIGGTVTGWALRRTKFLHQLSKPPPITPASERKLLLTSVAKAE